MKSSGGTVILIVVALALIVAMAITLWLSGSRSRHGYGFLPPKGIHWLGQGMCLCRDKIKNPPVCPAHGAGADAHV